MWQCVERGVANREKSKVGCVTDLHEPVARKAKGPEKRGPRVAPRVSRRKSAGEAVSVCRSVCTGLGGPRGVLCGLGGLHGMAGDIGVSTAHKETMQNANRLATGRRSFALKSK
jgi:hypothetical protein